MSELEEFCRKSMGSDFTGHSFIERGLIIRFGGLCRIACLMGLGARRRRGLIFFLFLSLS